MKKTYNLRSYAAKIISQVLDQGQSLNKILAITQNNIKHQDRALLQELCFGTLRTLSELEWYLQDLMIKPLIGQKRILHYLLMVGLYQILYTRIPRYAAIFETVSGASVLQYPKFKGVMNGVLRQFLRQKEVLTRLANKHDCRFLHPSWLLNRIQEAYPSQWEEIINANNQKPPRWIRVNRLHYTREEYLKLMTEAGILCESDDQCSEALRLLKLYPVNALPGFEAGSVTIQDISSQACITFLDPKNNEEILDLCAAPGGKTTHILEVAPKARVLAIDIDSKRLVLLKENLKRLHLNAEVMVGDGRFPEQWCRNKKFDRILLDAPCSATGVIRRHPDIKWLRRDCDIAELANLQKEILVAVWPYLKSGGVMLYATCSILPEENSEQISTFLKYNQDARLVETGSKKHPGQQKLPHPKEGDGFFYAKLIKI